MENHSDTLRPGTVIRGPERAYTVIKVLGQGGFGITYLVTGKVKVGNISLEGRFALKEHFISSLCSRDNATHAIRFSTPVADEVDRSMRAFVKEAQRLQSLGIDHPNIVKINEVFEANNTAYYVMEYLGGTTLRDYVEANGAMSPVAAKALLRPVVEAVAMLHHNNIAHYDIKPGNIMLHEEESGEVRPVLIDFGLSKHYNDRGHATSTLAAAGYTPGYAPVEQYAGVKEFTPQCDVYSLTATLYFCLTGHDPKPALELSAAEVERELSAILPPEEITPILRALSTMPATRTPDASALLDEVFDSAPAPVGLTKDEDVEIVDVKSYSERDSQNQETTRLPEPEKYNKEAKFPVKTTVVICAILAVILLTVFIERSNNSTDIDTEYVTDTIPTQVSVDTEQSDTVDFQQVVSSDETAKKSERTVSGKVVDENGETLIGVSVKAGLTTAITDYNGEFKMYIPEDVKQVVVSCVGCETKTVPVRDNMTICLQPEKKQTSFSPRTSYQNLDLHATRDGKNYYFSQSEWKSLSADEKSKYNRKGVVVIGGGLKFVVALHHSDRMTWDEAMKRYGNSLPSKSQAEVMAKQYEAINKAIIAFGGDEAGMCWTKTEYDSSSAWYVYMYNGSVNYYYKTSAYRVRAVAPVPSSAI